MKFKNELIVFSNKYLSLFRNPEVTDKEIADELSEWMFEHGVVMDCGESLHAMFPEFKALYSVREFGLIVSKICDVNILLTAIFSKYRYISHWSYEEKLTGIENRNWFILAFQRVLELENQEDVANASIFFRGNLIKLRLSAPINDLETRQCIQVGEHGEVNIWDCSSEQPIQDGDFQTQTKTHQMRELDAKNLLNLISMFFRTYESDMHVQEGGWKLVLENERGERFLFYGEGQKELYLDHIGLSALMRQYLNRPDLFLFDGKPRKRLQKQMDEYIFVNVFWGSGAKTYCYLCDDEFVAPGDEVVIPVGKNGKSRIVSVASVLIATEKNAPFPVEHCKKVISRIDK